MLVAAAMDSSFIKIKTTEAGFRARRRRSSGGEAASRLTLGQEMPKGSRNEGVAANSPQSSSGRTDQGHRRRQWRRGPASARWSLTCLASSDRAGDREIVEGVGPRLEWWGVDFEVKNHAQKIANLAPGYRALIPDLYRGKVGLDVAEAQHLFDGLNWPAAVKDIDASVKWLKENGSPKVGVTGFCMGGALSIASAVLVPEVDAVVGFYGSPSAELADAAKAKAPVQAHFGELDTFVGFSDVTAAKQLEEKLKSSGVPFEVHIYPGIGHAFLNTSPEGKQRRKGMGLNDDDPAAVELAWSRFSSWMNKFLSSA